MKKIKSILKPFIIIKKIIVNVFTAIEFYIMLILIFILLYLYFNHNQTKED